jgi:hypothetical protein
MSMKMNSTFPPPPKSHDTTGFRRSNDNGAADLIIRHGRNARNRSSGEFRPSDGIGGHSTTK